MVLFSLDSSTKPLSALRVRWIPCLTGTLLPTGTSVLLSLCSLIEVIADVLGTFSPVNKKVRNAIYNCVFKRQGVTHTCKTTTCTCICTCTYWVVPILVQMVDFDLVQHTCTYNCTCTCTCTRTSSIHVCICTCNMVYIVVQCTEQLHVHVLLHLHACRCLIYIYMNLIANV